LVAGDIWSIACEQGKVFKDLFATYVTDGMLSGDKLVITDSDDVNQGTYVIDQVLSETSLLLTTDVTSSVAATEEYNIDRLLIGSVLCTYLAARHDLSNQLITVESTDDILTAFDLDTIDENCPLALGMFMAYQNAQSTVAGYAITADTLVEHSSAADYISNYEVYAIAPLTHLQTVHSMYSSHVDAMSEAEESK